jgi:hypothetical protein
MRQYERYVGMRFDRGNRTFTQFQKHHGRFVRHGAPLVFGGT